MLKELDKQRTWAVDLLSEVTMRLETVRLQLENLRYEMREPDGHLSGDLGFKFPAFKRVSTT